MRRALFFFVCLTMLVTSCQWSPASWRPKGDDGVKLKIHRYDRVVDEFVSLNSFSSLQRMNVEYPMATRLLIEDVLAIGSVEEPRIEQRLRRFYMDSTMQVLLEDVHNKYADLDAEEEELSKVFGQIKQYDPDFKIPQVYTQISGLNQSMVVGDSILGISLDKYLGHDYSLYKKYYHDYQRQMMDRCRLVPDALFYYLTHEYPLFPKQTYTLLDYVVDYGKIHWVIARCRNISLAEEAGFDEERVKRFRENEGKVWQWLEEHHALESSDTLLIQDLMEPHESLFCGVVDAPSQIGLWIGLQIVDHYMKKHPEVTVGQLLQAEDYKTLFRESGYHPTTK